MLGQSGGSSSGGDASHRFYTVSLSKFSLLYFGTTGLYSVFWFYRLWRDVEIQGGRPLYPMLRALFAVFFVHQLFQLIKSKDVQSETKASWQPNKLAWLYILIYVLQLLFFVIISNNEWGAAAHFAASLVILFMQFYVIYQIQLAVNRAAEDPFGDSNQKMTLENQLWMAFGIFMWVRTILLVVHPAEAPVPPEEAPSEPSLNQISS